MGGFVAVGIFAAAILLMFIHDASWVPESMRRPLKNLAMFLWGLIIIGMVIGAIFTPPWHNYS